MKNYYIRDWDIAEKTCIYLYIMHIYIFLYDIFRFSKTDYQVFFLLFTVFSFLFLFLCYTGREIRKEGKGI